MARADGDVSSAHCRCQLGHSAQGPRDRRSSLRCAQQVRLSAGRSTTAPPRTIRTGRSRSPTSSRRPGSSTVISWPSTYPEEVLAATDRQNISPAKQKEVAQALQKQNVPITVQLILGIPGDTLRPLEGLLRRPDGMGHSRGLSGVPLFLLPNAPAAEKSFVADWEIETAECSVTTQHLCCGPSPKDNLLTGKVITRTRPSHATTGSG